MIITVADQKDIIQNLIGKLRSLYVYPEAADQISLAMEKHLLDGEYRGLTEGDYFALALTMHLQEVNHDEHLWVRFHPESLPQDDGALRLNPEWQEAQRREARLDNFGIHKTERLPGNIGRIDIHHFYRMEWGTEVHEAAMRFLENTGALIIDLRECTGGYPDMIAWFAGFFFGKEPVNVNNIYWRDDDRTQEYWTTPDLPGRWPVEKMVFILTSKTTFSGGEVFARILQSRGRARVIGEETDGGFHPGASYRLHPHFQVFIPIGRTIDPLGGKDLEGIGITPDIPLPREHAFTAAYNIALRSILENCEMSSTELNRVIAKEIREALEGQESKYRICPRCFYPNSIHMQKCKNCDEKMK